MSDCKRPRCDPSSNNTGKGHSTSPTPSKNSSSQNPQAKTKAKSDPKKRMALSNKERARVSLLWARAVMEDNHDIPSNDVASLRVVLLLGLTLHTYPGHRSKRCLHPLQWLTNQQSLSSKKIHLKAANGTIVKVLILPKCHLLCNC